MKDGLFFAVSRLNIIVLNFIKACADILIAISTAMTNAVLRIIDSQRMDHAVSAIQQTQEMTELNILTSIDEVRNDAVKHGAWSEEHTGRLNFFGTILYNEHDWEEEQVYRYLHEVIATGPDIEFED